MKRTRIKPVYGQFYMTHNWKWRFKIEKAVDANRIRVYIYDQKTPDVINTIYEADLSLYTINLLDNDWGIFIDIPIEEPTQTEMKL